MIDPMPPLISVVIPVYGSETILPELVAQLETELGKLSGSEGFEVILVHDHGPDNSWGVIENLVSTRPWLKAIDLRMNAGQHNAILAGLNFARGKFTVTMDDDLQHSPGDIKSVIAALKNGHDAAYVQFGHREHALWKRIGSAFNDRVAQRLLDKPKGLYLSPFRGMTAEIREHVAAYRGPFIYLDGLILQATDRIAQVDGTHHPRSDGRSGYSLRKSISLWLQMATSFSIGPLRIISFAGIVASVVGFILATVVVIQKLTTPDLSVGWASLIVAILITGGLQLLALGAIGEYVGRVLLSVNERPQFQIRSKRNLD